MWQTWHAHLARGFHGRDARATRKQKAKAEALTFDCGPRILRVIITGGTPVPLESKKAKAEALAFDCGTRILRVIITGGTPVPLI
jgi:predicted Rossmann-fold nucleotide-binding protein